MKQKTNKNNGVPVYGTISRNGNIFVVEYKIQKDRYGYKKTATEGYDATVFEGCPPDMPVLDFRTADEQSLVTMLLKDNWFVKETDIPFKPETRPSISLKDYLDIYVFQTGATLTTVKAVLKAEKEKAIA